MQGVSPPSLSWILTLETGPGIRGTSQVFVAVHCTSEMRIIHMTRRKHISYRTLERLYLGQTKAGLN